MRREASRSVGRMGPGEPRDGRGADRDRAADGVADTDGDAFRRGLPSAFRAASGTEADAPSGSDGAAVDAGPDEGSQQRRSVPHPDAAPVEQAEAPVTSLASERCEVCRPGMPHLSDDEATELAKDIDG